MVNEYQKEQFEAHKQVIEFFGDLSGDQRKMLDGRLKSYLNFRSRISDYLSEHFKAVCSMKCYGSRLSACCSKEGIITFFADVVVNASVSTEQEMNTLLHSLGKENTGYKCIYLTDTGCMWRMKPIVCEMFLCDDAKNKVFKGRKRLSDIWEELNDLKKKYTWPDRPVLFDQIEKEFITKGFSSPLMYLHNSPGLLRVKQKAGMK
jgi:hypothetical protein